MKMNALRIMLASAIVLAGSSAWGRWVYEYNNGVERYYDDGSAVCRTDDVTEVSEYKVTVSDGVSPEYSGWYGYPSEITLPNPSSTMDGRVWGGWKVTGGCFYGEQWFPSGATYSICGATTFTGTWLLPSEVRTIKSAPKPKATVGKYAGYVYVTWSRISGASHYMVRRGTSNKYSKSKVVAYVMSNNYKDTYPSWYPKKKFYYWIVPCNRSGKGKAIASKYAYGSTKLSVSMSLNVPYDNNGNQYVYAGDKISFSVKKNGHTLSASKCKWKVVSGSAYASVSKNGVLTAKKKGKTVISASYGGKTVKKTVSIRSHLSVDAAIFREMNLDWGEFQLKQNTSDFVWSSYYNAYPDYSEHYVRISVGAGGIVSVSGVLDGKTFSGKGRFGASSGETGYREIAASFGIDLRDESGAWVDSRYVTIEASARKQYGYWDASIDYIRIHEYDYDWDDDDY